MSAKIWIWGRHPVLEALRAGTATEVLLAAERRPAPVIADILDAARVGGVRVRTVPPSDLERLAPGQNTQDVAALITERLVHDVRPFLESISAMQTAPFLLVLDQVQDPHNVGSLIRTAVGAGVQGVILPERNSAPITGTVAKVAAGALSHITVVRVTNLTRALEEIRSAGIWVAGLEGEAAQSLYAADFRVPTALVIGSEGKGLRRLVREKCDFLVQIPLLGSIESLNASVAGAVAMYEVVRQRLLPAGPNHA